MNVLRGWAYEEEDTCIKTPCISTATHTHTHTHTHKHSLTHSLTHTHTLTHSLTHTLSHTLTLSLSHTHAGLGHRLQSSSERLESYCGTPGLPLPFSLFLHFSSFCLRQRECVCACVCIHTYFMESLYFFSFFVHGTRDSKTRLLWV